MDKTKTNAEDQVQDSTVVEQVDVDIDALFGGGAGADSIMLPENETNETAEEKKTMFSKSKTADMTFFDNPTATTEEDAEEKKGVIRPWLEKASSCTAASCWDDRLVIRILSPHAQSGRSDINHLLQVIRNQPLPRVWQT